MIAVRVTRGAVAAVVVATFLALGAVVVGNATQRFRLAPVLSGSMSPAIPQGALVMAEPIPSSDLRVGDVLLFTPPVPGHPLVMHRIHERHRSGDVLAFRTKGDANAAPDAWTIRVKGPRAWRVAHAVPHVGTAIGWMSTPDVRVGVLALGALILVICGLRAVWALRPISWYADDPYGEQRRARRRHATMRALGTTGVGVLLVAVLAVAGLASAQFTASATPPTPGYGSGQLASPAPMTCSWTSATQLRFDWQNTSPTFTTGYDVRRSTTSGSGYTTIGTTSPATTVTYTDTPSPVTTVRHYVTRATRATWTSADSNERASNGCIGAVNLVAGTTQGFAGDGGPASAARLANPQDVAVDASDNVYIADTTNNRIRRIDASTGVITTIAGGGASTGCTFAGAATSAALNAPRGVAVDRSTGDVYVADTGNNCIRKVSGGSITRFAGGGATTACTYSGAPTGVSMSAPRGLRMDSTSGTLYIADTTRRCIRKVSGGTMSQVAGAGTGTASPCTFSGAATAVILSTTVSDVDVDGSGNVYIADTGRSCIRKVASGTVSQFAGGGSNTACSFAGAPTAASLSAPGGIAVDAGGQVVIADTGRRCVRIVSGATVNLVAGTGTSGTAGDNGPAVAALLNTPSDVAANASGDLWIADTGVDRVRRVEGPV